MKVLIVGADGFLGRNLVSKHLSLGHSVTGIFNKNQSNLNEQATNIPINQLNNLHDEFNIVYILSAYIPYGNMDMPSQELVKVNVELPNKVCSQFKNARIIYASSVSVYGTHAESINETSSFNSPTLYGLSKLAGEFIVMNHPSYSIVRFSSLYGKGMKENTFLPQVISNAKENGSITIYGKGTRKQDYLHVNDAVNYLISAANKTTNDVFLGVYGQSYSNLEVAEAVAEYLKNVKITFKGEDFSPSSTYNNSETLKKLNFKPQVTLKEGIGTLIS